MSCVRCSKSHSVPQAFLLACSECRRYWHHRCHIPPVEDAELIARIEATTNNDVDNGIDGWVCKRCSKKAQAQATKTLSRQPSQMSKDSSHPSSLATSRSSTLVARSPYADIEGTALFQPEASRTSSRASLPQGPTSPLPTSSAMAQNTPLTISGHTSDAPQIPVIDLDHADIQPSISLSPVLDSGNTDTIIPTVSNAQPEAHPRHSSGIGYPSLQGSPAITSDSSRRHHSSDSNMTLEEQNFQANTSSPHSRLKINPVVDEGSQAMDVDTINGIPVETERFSGHLANSQALPPTGGIIPEQIQPVENVVTSGPIHEQTDTPPTGGANDTQMDVDDDMEELYWNPPSRLGTPMILVPGADETQRTQSPTFSASRPSVPPQPVPQTRPNSLVHDATGLDQLLTTHIRVLHANGENPWKSLQGQKPREIKRKPHRKPKANRPEMCINTQSLMTFSLAEWIRKEHVSSAALKAL